MNHFKTNSAGPVITVKFVLSDHGWSIHTIVTSLLLAGQTAARDRTWAAAWA